MRRRVHGDLLVLLCLITAMSLALRLAAPAVPPEPPPVHVVELDASFHSGYTMPIEAWDIRLHDGRALLTEFGNDNVRLTAVSATQMATLEHALETSRFDSLKAFFIGNLDFRSYDLAITWSDGRKHQVLLQDDCREHIHDPDERARFFHVWTTLRAIVPTP